MFLTTGQLDDEQAYWAVQQQQTTNEVAWKSTQPCSAAWLILPVHLAQQFAAWTCSHGGQRGDTTMEGSPCS
jgi:hypothetical protein